MVGRVMYIHDPAIDVAELFEAKEPRAMSGIIEGIALIRKPLVAVGALAGHGGLRW